MIPVGSVTIGGGGSACTEVIVAVGPAFVRFAYTRSLSPFGFLEADHQNSALLLGATRCASAGSTRQGLVSLPCATSSSTASQLSDLAYGPQVTRTTPLRSASERFENGVTLCHGRLLIPTAAVQHTPLAAGLTNPSRSGVCADQPHDSLTPSCSLTDWPSDRHTSVRDGAIATLCKTPARH